MPHKPNPYGSFPLTLRDYLVADPRRGELLLNYDTNELYFCKGSTGDVVSVARDIYDKILAAKIKNNNIIIYDWDLISPLPDKDKVIPPTKERMYNSIYYIVTNRKNRSDESNNPLTAPTWAVLENKTFLGKVSGYNQNLDDEG